MIGEEDRLDIGPKASEQRCKILDAAIDERDLRCGAYTHERSSMAK
jgi:hypothetical protein